MKWHLLILNIRMRLIIFGFDSSSGNIIDILGTVMAYLKVSYGFIESFTKETLKK